MKLLVLLLTLSIFNFNLFAREPGKKLEKVRAYVVGCLIEYNLKGTVDLAIYTSPYKTLDFSEVKITMQALNMKNLELANSIYNRCKKARDAKDTVKISGTYFVSGTNYDVYNLTDVTFEELKSN